MTTSAIFLSLAVPLLCFAAARDIATRLIPDGISIGLAVLGFALRLVESIGAAAVSLGVAFLLFAGLLVLAMRGFLGGGDVKLIAATATGLAPDQALFFVVATVMAGGVLGVAYLLAPYVVPQVALAPGGGVLRRVIAVETRRLRRRGPLPYAVAIAAGGVILLLFLLRG